LTDVGSCTLLAPKIRTRYTKGDVDQFIQEVPTNHVAFLEEAFLNPVFRAWPKIAVHPSGLMRWDYWETALPEARHTFAKTVRRRTETASTSGCAYMDMASMQGGRHIRRNLDADRNTMLL
jgi:hypothetical protein